MPTDELTTILNRQTFVGVIGAMETFFSDAFINLVLDNKFNFRMFVQTHPEFSKRKFELKEIFEKHQELSDIVKKVLLDTIYHNLGTVKQMYQDTLYIKFPDISKCMKHVKTRHDLVHRNGKTKDGDAVVVDRESIIKASDDIIEMVELVMKELENDNIPF